jgi:hypothetical protein
MRHVWLERIVIKVAVDSHDPVAVIHRAASAVI